MLWCMCVFVDIKKMQKKAETIFYQTITTKKVAYIYNPCNV